jgi:hypothetical protein
MLNWVVPHGFHSGGHAEGASVGKLVYGMPSIEVEFDDRLLAHVKAVITSKLRRDESFTFTWEFTGDDNTPSHSSVWLDPAIPLQFVFEGEKDPPLNREWIEELNRSANTPSGLKITPEPVAK